MGMYAASLKNSSTFSYPGRMSPAFRYITEKVNFVPKKVVCLGAGCFEPLTTARMLQSDAVVTAVDIDAKIIETLQKILGGEQIEISSLESAVCNKDDNGIPRPNHDLTEKLYMDIAYTELRKAGLKPAEFIEDRKIMAPKYGARIVPVCYDAAEHCKNNRGGYEIAVMNFLLVNFLKGGKRDDARRFTESVFGGLMPYGVLQAGVTPAGLFGKNSEINIFIDSGGEVNEIVIDALAKSEVNGQSKIFGQYMVNVSLQKVESEAQTAGINTSISKDRIFDGIGINMFTAPNVKEYFAGLQENIFLAAIKKGDRYFIWEADKDIIRRIPRLRHSFNFITNLT